METSDTLGRPLRQHKQKSSFFDIKPSWTDHWWGMPSFSMGDARPEYQITINFITAKDVAAFAKRADLPVSIKSDSAWFPHQKHLSGQYCYDGTPTNSRYPVCIPSKGRADCQSTGKLLDRMGVSYRFFVEETEYDEYIKHLGKTKVVSMPFSNLGQGSVPARNFIWEWCKEREYKRHWTVDDNIGQFTRCHNNRRLRVHGGGFFSAMEDFVDRYENVVMAGPHDQGFVMDRGPNLSPFLLNSRIYSCILLDTSLSYRWRGRYNEDTDLSLRLLKDGYCTMLFHALLMNKGQTVGAGKPMKGGNTDNVYNTDDHRLAFAESLQKQHPDVVKVVWKFNRWHHQVDYLKFRKNKLQLRADITPTVGPNEYGMHLVEKGTDSETNKAD